MFARSHTVTVTTDGSGNATAYTGGVVNGRLFEIRYVKTDFANDLTITVTGETTGIALWTETSVNASATRCPRQATYTVIGIAAVYTDDGKPVLDYLVLADERIKIVIASGGVTKTGTFYFVLG